MTYLFYMHFVLGKWNIERTPEGSTYNNLRFQPEAGTIPLPPPLFEKLPLNNKFELK